MSARLRRVAWVALLVGALDGLSTWCALGVGAVEGNPLAAHSHDRLGVVPAVTLAAFAGPLVMVLAEGCRRLLPSRWAALVERTAAIEMGAVVGFVALRSVVVVSNIALIVRLA